jgi:hypothetical protein
MSRSVLTWAAAVGAAALLCLALLFAGEGLLQACADNWLKLDDGYCKSLAPEVGAAGFDAVVVGGLAALIAARISRSKGLFEHELLIERARFDVDKAASLQALTDVWRSQQRLHGLKFGPDVLSSRSLTRFSFVSRTSASTFDHVIFEGCTLDQCQFGNGSRGSTFDNADFRNTLVERSSFANCIFRFDKTAVAFAGAAFRLVDFRNVTIRNAEMGAASFSGCTFWGARLENSVLPMPVHSLWARAGTIIHVDADTIEVKTLRQFAREKPLHALWFLVRLNFPSAA